MELIVTYRRAGCPLPLFFECDMAAHHACRGDFRRLMCAIEIVHLLVVLTPSRHKDHQDAAEI